MNFIFFSITEHPWGREMLSQLINSGFVPSLIIEENSEGGKIERGKTVNGVTLFINSLKIPIISMYGKTRIPTNSCE